MKMGDTAVSAIADTRRVEACQPFSVCQRPMKFDTPSEVFNTMLNCYDLEVRGILCSNDVTSGHDDLKRQFGAAPHALSDTMDAADYKHLVLGLVFLKCICDAFEAKRADLLSQVAKGADPEAPAEFRSEGIFWIPKESRWQILVNNATQPTLGRTIDHAMMEIELENPSLQGVLPRGYARRGLDKRRLGLAINLISQIGCSADYLLHYSDRPFRLESFPTLETGGRHPNAVLIRAT